MDLYLAEEQLKSRIEQTIHELDTNFNNHANIDVLFVSVIQVEYNLFNYAFIQCFLLNLFKILFYMFFM